MNLLKRKILYLIMVLFAGSSICAMEEGEGESAISQIQAPVRKTLIKGVFKEGQRDIPMGVCCRVAVLPYCDQDGIVHLPDISAETMELIAQMDDKANDFELFSSLDEQFAKLLPLLKAGLKSSYKRGIDLLKALKKFGMPHFIPAVMRYPVSGEFEGDCQDNIMGIFFLRRLGPGDEGADLLPLLDISAETMKLIMLMDQQATGFERSSSLGSSSLDGQFTKLRPLLEASLQSSYKRGIDLLKALDKLGMSHFIRVVMRYPVMGKFKGGCKDNIIPMSVCCRRGLGKYFSESDGIIHLPNISAGSMKLIVQMDDKASDLEPSSSLNEQFGILCPLFNQCLRSWARVDNLLSALSWLGMSDFIPIVKRIMAWQIACKRYDCQRYAVATHVVYGPELPKEQRVLGLLRQYDSGFTEQFAHEIADLIIEKGTIKYRRPACGGAFCERHDAAKFPISWIDGLPLTTGFVKKQIQSFTGVLRKRVELYTTAPAFFSPDCREIEFGVS